MTRLWLTTANKRYMILEYVYIESSVSGFDVTLLLSIEMEV